MEEVITPKIKLGESVRDKVWNSVESSVSRSIIVSVWNLVIRITNIRL